MCEVTYDTVLAHDRRVRLDRVHDGAVLDGSARPDDDCAVVSAQHRTRPDRCFRSDAHVANHHGVGVHEGLGIDGRYSVA